MMTKARKAAIVFVFEFRSFTITIAATRKIGCEPEVS